MEGCTDGTWKGQRYFSCRYGCGFFCPVTTLKPRTSFVPDNSSPSLHGGPKSHLQGPANNTAPTESRPNPQGPIENFPRGSRPNVQGPATPRESRPNPQGPIENFPRGSRPNVQGPATPRESSSAAPSITLNTAVQIGNPRNPWYGIVKWVGHFPRSGELMAGIELVSVVYSCVPSVHMYCTAQEEYSDQCGDGEVYGVRYFKCDYGKAFFCPVTHLRVDNRFADSAPSQSLSDRGENRKLLK